MTDAKNAKNAKNAKDAATAPAESGDAFVDAAEPESVPRTEPSDAATPVAPSDATQLMGPSDAGFVRDGGITDASTARDAGLTEAGSVRQGVEAGGLASAVLSGLTVEGAAAPMRPAFDPATRRYSVIATERFDDLDITPKTDPSLLVEVDGEPIEPGTTRTIAAEPGATHDLVVTNDEGESSTYSLVVLPPNFPDLVVTTLEPGSSMDPIYVALMSDTVDYIAKLDAHAVPLFYRAMDAHSYDFKKLDNGELAYAILVGGAQGAEHVLLDQNFDEIGTVRAQGLANTDVHEFRLLPNGNYVVLSYEPAYRDMTAYGGAVDQRVDDCILQELTPDLQVAFQWNSWDHVAYDETVYGKPRDYAHINSVYVEDDGNWLVSSRGLSQVLEIDRGTGDVIWRFGGMSGEFEFVDDPYSNLCGQHTVTRTPEGHILMFDNGQHCWPENPDRGKLTRVAEFDLDETNKTARLVWSYHRDDAYTYSQGSAQRLANGNTFIGWGIGPRSMASEVDPDGNLVFDMEASEGFSTYRAFRIAD